jgi:hypothetical protein
MIINLTPHALHIRQIDGGTTVIPPSGTVARRAVTREELAPLEGIAVRRSVFGPITGLPEPQENVVYVVSALCAQGLNRTDVLVPGEAIRDEAGRVIGCDGLCQI